MAEHVLIIDDDEVLRYALSRALSRLGYDVSEAADLAGTERTIKTQKVDWVVLALVLVVVVLRLVSVAFAFSDVDE